MADVLSGAPGEPNLEDFQVRAARGTLKTLSGGENALLIGPTGSGKTAMMLTVAQGYADRVRGGDGRVLILTHRQRLVEQVLKKEAKIWARNPVGHIASQYASNPENQEPRLVVGMAQSAAARLGNLARYDLVIVDECHHMYDPAKHTGGEMSDYEKVIRAIADQHGMPQVMGATATAFRRQGELHEWLKSAPCQTVTYQEALAAGRIVPPRTVEMDYRLANGRRAQEFLDEELAQSRSLDVDEKIGGRLKQARAETPEQLAAFSDQVVAGWKREAAGLKTLGFQDSLPEMFALEAAFQRAGVQVATMHSNQPARLNDAAANAFAEPGGPDVLLSVGMIGEGFDVPEAGCTLATNGCPPRSWMAQMIGRSMRSAEGKSEALYLDFGAGSRVWGRMEEQIDLQHEHRRLQVTPGMIAKRRMLEDLVDRPDPGLPVMGFAARKGNLFAVETGGGRVQAYWQEREPVRDSKHQSNGLKATKIALGSGDKKASDVNDVRAFIDEELTKNPGWHARNRRPEANGTRPDHELLAKGYASVADTLRVMARGVRDQRIQMTGRVDSLETPQDRTATAIKQVRSAAAREPGPAREVLARLCDDLSVTPEQTRRESVYLAGVVAGEMAEHTRGAARQGLRAVSARLVTDLGQRGVAAVEARDPKAVPSMANYTAMVFQGAAKSFAETGNTELSALAGRWGRYCRTVARTPVDARRTESGREKRPQIGDEGR